MQQLGHLSRCLSQIFRGKSTTISPQQRNTLTLRLVLQHSLLWARLAHKFGVAAAESLRQQVPTQVHGFRASNPGFGCTAHSMIACSFMGLMCPKSVTCKPQRNIAFLPRNHRRSFADTCFTLHQKPVLYTFEDKDLEINAQMCVHMNFVFDVLTCWFIFIHKLTPQTLNKVENSTHAYTTCVVRLSACVCVCVCADTCLPRIELTDIENLNFCRSDSRQHIT